MNLRDPDLYALAEHLWLLAGADDTDRHFSEQMWGVGLFVLLSPFIMSHVLCSK